MSNSPQRTPNSDQSMDEADKAATCSAAYSLFAALFEYPDDERLELLREHVPATELQSVISAIAPDLAAKTDWDALGRIGDGDELQVEYTRLFDAGTSGPPCSLHEGAHRPSRMGTLEDLVRFYSCFGLCRAEQPNDMPDHLSAQLEFMHYLSYGEAMLCSEGDDPADYRRGQRDFLLHHTAQWLVKLKNTLIENDAADFFLELATLLQGFINLHAQHLIAQVGRGTQDITIPLTTIDDQPTKWADEAELES